MDAGAGEGGEGAVRGQENGVRTGRRGAASAHGHWRVSACGDGADAIGGSLAHDRWLADVGSLGCGNDGVRSGIHRTVRSRLRRKYSAEYQVNCAVLHKQMGTTAYGKTKDGFWSGVQALPVLSAHDVGMEKISP